MLKEKGGGKKKKKSKHLDKEALELSLIRKANEQVKQSEVTVCERSDELK